MYLARFEALFPSAPIVAQFFRHTTATRAPRRKFSLRVTASRCHGLTQPRLRHRWSISRPLGTGPIVSSCASLWAESALLFLFPVGTLREPYPPLFGRSTHRQHPSVFSLFCTFAQNLSSSVPFIFLVHDPEIHDKKGDKDHSNSYRGQPD